MERAIQMRATQSMEPIRTISSRTVVLPHENVDTDQIIPARFLTTTSRHGLGRHAFADWRYHPSGEPNHEFPLNHPAAQGAQVLVAGHNFGCGSSREHAPWALLDHGFRAVVSTQIADIFRNNATRNGLLPIVLGDEAHQWLLQNPGARVTIDLESCTLAAEGGPTAEFPFDSFAAHCLINGVDELGYLLSHAGAIARYEVSCT
jgi:3-isopropylmalate/(R)-2-methylmalate dehydratase small subunit